ncbi:tripartite tricarboxylate transporter substrate binding protein [Cupriavidus basilensis]|uniref:Tripartite tricarboxylate transporter substrate binding protein n=1 Tax=Cupriavidus basilensis TaxID=68895 RepID=A0ABT6AVQ1_9BURK|nr:tripartite tricarboxylate transporter substrate binding protein [Cupriavidus basilensis]MDF3836702.1 tripartite tricarboxylate transporter substrate binding protein [Cupriavidus basilensis]
MQVLNLLCASVLAVLAQGITATVTQAAEPFPSKPVRIIVPAAAGGSLDIIARLVAQKMGEKLGQTVIVENRAGGDTLVATRYVKDTPADGYTLLAQANGFTILPSLKQDAGYDPLKDFTAIGLMARSPMIMLVSANDPSRNVKEFIVRAKSDKLSFASGGVGGPPHMAAAMFLRMQGLELTNVPYKGNSLALPDVVAGRVTTIFDGYTSCVAYLKSGKLRPLAVTSATRNGPLPDVPTFKEQGIDYEYTLWMGLLARAGTPKEIVGRLSESLQYATSSKDLIDRLVSEGADPSFVTPEAFNKYLAAEVPQMEKLVMELKLPRQ